MQIRLQRLGYAVVGVASSGDEAIAKAVELRPGLVLMDVRLEGEMDGIEAARSHGHSFLPWEVFLKQDSTRILVDNVLPNRADSCTAECTCALSHRICCNAARGRGEADNRSLPVEAFSNERTAIGNCPKSGYCLVEVRLFHAEFHIRLWTMMPMKGRSSITRYADREFKRES